MLEKHQGIKCTGTSFMCTGTPCVKSGSGGKCTGTPQMCTGTHVQKIDSGESVPVHH